MIKLIPQKQDDTVAISISGKLMPEDYDEVVPELERKIKNHGKVNLYCEMEALEEGDPTAVWRDMKFDAKHLNDFRRVAIVGDEKWMEWMTKMSEPFTSAEVKFFTDQEKPEAIEWVVATDEEENEP